jgi:hypothetical protein
MSWQRKSRDLRADISLQKLQKGDSLDSLPQPFRLGRKRKDTDRITFSKGSCGNFRAHMTSKENSWEQNRQKGRGKAMARI